MVVPADSSSRVVLVVGSVSVLVSLVWVVPVGAVELLPALAVELTVPEEQASVHAASRRAAEAWVVGGELFIDGTMVAYLRRVDGRGLKLRGDPRPWGQRTCKPPPSRVRERCMLEQLPATVDVVIEYPRGAMIKRRRDGSVDFVAPLPCPYNYGSIPGLVAGDGDALDAVVLGPRLSVGTRVRVPVLGIIDFIDDGFADPKVICGEAPLGSLQSAGLLAFFTVYALFKRSISRIRGSNRVTRSAGWVRRPKGGCGQAREGSRR